MKLEKEEIVPAFKELFEGYKEAIIETIKKEMGRDSYYDCDWDKRDKLINDRVSFNGFIDWINSNF